MNEQWKVGKIVFYDEDLFIPGVTLKDLKS